MQNLCNVLGLSIDDMTELFSCLAAIIMSSVFMGHFVFYAFAGFISFFVDIACALYKFAVRYFTNARKKEGEQT